MALESQIIKTYSDGSVLVEIGSKKFEPKYYKVSGNKADEFQKEYKSNQKKMQLTSTGILLAAIAAVLVPVSYYTKAIKNKFARAAAGIATGVAGGIGSILLSRNIEVKSHERLINKYGAKQIDY